MRDGPQGSPLANFWEATACLPHQAGRNPERGKAAPRSDTIESYLAANARVKSRLLPIERRKSFWHI